MQQSDIRGKPVGMDVALYDRHAPGILASFRQYISNPQDAEDLLVEVFLAALSRPGFADLTAEHQQAWLHRVAHNKMIDHLRRLNRVTLVSLDEVLESESGEPTPEQYSINREKYIHLYRSLAHLSSEGQELIYLRYGEGLRLVEIAARLRKPGGTVRKQLLRTLRRLRTLYDQPHMSTQKERK